MRQAVVVIHGIGEQKPMATLRGFVDSISDYTSEKKWIQVYNIPDTISQGYELRQLALYYGKDRTDFYEYYWANNMRGTKLSSVWTWLIQLLWRTPGNIPSRIRWIYFITWLIALVYLYIIVSGGISLSQGMDWLKLPWIVLAGNIVLHFFTMIMTLYMGDAARYTYAAPENIDERNKIRKAGIELLHRLNQDKNYERVIVVGHSLGSMIGYDMLKHLWTQYHKSYTVSVNDAHPVMTKYNEQSEKGFDLSTDIKLKEFQELQHALFKEQRDRGNPWKVTDFITLGSPLAHGQLLMAESMNAFEARKKEREFPVSPPLQERNGGISYSRSMESLNGGSVKMNIIHHAGHFGFTRWLNLYYQSDFVGGPLREKFGLGIRDVKVSSRSWGNKIPFLMHTRYWGEVNKSKKEMRESVEILKEVILRGTNANKEQETRNKE